MTSRTSRTPHPLSVPMSRCQSRARSTETRWGRRSTLPGLNGLTAGPTSCSSWLIRQRKGLLQPRFQRQPGGRAPQGQDSILPKALCDESASHVWAVSSRARVHGPRDQGGGNGRGTTHYYPQCPTSRTFASRPHDLELCCPEGSVAEGGKLPSEDMAVTPGNGKFSSTGLLGDPHAPGSTGREGRYSVGRGTDPDCQGDTGPLLHSVGKEGRVSGPERVL